MTTKGPRRKLSLAMLSVLTLSSFTAFVFVEESKNGKDLERIAVTAQKRTERLSEVPLAVSVINAEQIDSVFSSSFENLQSLSPSVSFKKGTTSRNSAVTIRGIGTISFSVAAEPSVSTVVDGVVLGRSGQVFTDLYDLERIEVLRGPQGTLFGKNSSAGVVNITTKRPHGDTEGMLEITLFQGNEYRLKGKIQGQITDKSAGSFIVTKSGYDGNLFNVYNDEQVNGYDKQGFRAMLDVETSRDSKMLFIFERAESNDNCCADIEGLPSGRNPNSVAAPNSNGIVNGVTDFDLNQRKVDHDFKSRTIDKTTAFSVQFDKERGDYSLTSITAYREWDNTEYREGDFTSIAGASTQPVFDVPFQLHDVGPQTWRQFSQELRVYSPVGDKLDWQAGVFLWKMDSDRNFTRDASCQNNSGQFDQAISHYLTTNMDIETPDEQQVADFITSEDLTCNANDLVSATAYMGTEFTNGALFGDGKYHFTDNFTLLFGARYTDDNVDFTHKRVSNDPYGRRGVGVRPATENTNFSSGTDHTNTSIKVGAQCYLDEAGMVYTTYSQGYKGPGFNVFYNMADNDSLPIAEETSDAYELGYKYASHDFMFNAVIFRTEIEEFQANNFDDSDGTTITRLTNAGNVSTQGIEFDFVWQVVEALMLSGGLSKIDAEIDELYCPIQEINNNNCSPRSGLDVPFSPNLKYLLTVEYLTELSYMDILWNATYVYTDEQVATLPENTANDDYGYFHPSVRLPDYSQLNASVAFLFDEDAYRISLIGKKLTYEQYFTSYSGDGFRYQIPRDADRYFGVQFRINF
jgi:iron complex outermembrane receptor protein